MKSIDTSIIISTYNSPLWLQKVLWSYDCQTFRDFEVIIADDGSRLDTKALVDAMRLELSYPIRHVWHEDDGFQKTIILNKATVSAKGKYLVYTDGDCIARADFLQAHIDRREAGYFLSGGYFKLPMNISRLISEEHIKLQDCFAIEWLVSKGLRKTFKTNKLTAKGMKQKLLDSFTPTKATFDGMNASCWKIDMFEVNGFDERMQYGGEDRELGERLFNSGIKAKQIRYSAICLHLDHSRDYVNYGMIKKNLVIRNLTKKKNLKWTEFGMIKD